MDEKNEQLISQYDIFVNNAYKSRGTLIINSDKGLLMLTGYNYSEKKAEMENMIKNALINAGYDNVDLFIKNTEGNYITTNRYASKFVLKKWFNSQECELNEIEDIKKAAKNLAMLHNAFDHVELETEDNEKLISRDICKEYYGYNQEIKRIKKFIYNKKKKNELEVTILNNIDRFYNQGMEASNILKEIDYNKMLEESIGKQELYHGAYNYHNVLILSNSDTATVDFTHSGQGPQIFDLYCFIRKTLEKNEWDARFFDVIIEEYEKYKLIEKSQFALLYVLFYYPEKFRKLLNAYYNGQKVWASGRISKKLAILINTELQRNNFIKYLEKNI